MYTNMQIHQQQQQQFHSQLQSHKQQQLEQAKGQVSGGYCRFPFSLDLPLPPIFVRAHV